MLVYKLNLINKNKQLKYQDIDTLKYDIFNFLDWNFLIILKKNFNMNI